VSAPAPHATRAASLPNLIVIGAPKCGTSALHYYLDLHPEVQMSSPKELRFFLDADDFDPEPFISEPGERRLLGGTWNWWRGIDWYANHFSARAPVRGESTPPYSCPWYPGVAARMAEVLPEAKLIFLVRDPVDRIVSHYIQFRAVGREWRPLQAAVERPSSVYVACSRYASLLYPFLDRFGRSRIHLMRQEDLLHRRRETLRELFGFLGVDERFWSPKMERLRNSAASKGRGSRVARRLMRSRLAAPVYRLPQEAKWVIERLAGAVSGPVERSRVDDGLRRRLLEELQPEVASLEELTGWDLREWRSLETAEAHS
jgi:sulfotransferase family protein